MTKLILIVFLLFPILCHGAAFQGVTLTGCAVNSGGAEKTCSGATIQQSEVGETGSATFAFNSYQATQITFTGTTGTGCRIDSMSKCQTSDCTQTETVYLYSDSGSDTVGSLLGTYSTVLDSVAWDTTWTWRSQSTCAGTCTYTNGTKYWLVWKTNATDGTNYISLRTDNSCAVQRRAWGTNGSSWTYGTADCVSHKLYNLE